MSSAEAPAVSLDWRLGEDIVADDDSGSSSKARDSASVSAAPPVGAVDAGNGEAADGEDSEAATTNQSDEVAEPVKASLDSSEVDALLDVGRMLISLGAAAVPVDDPTNGGVDFAGDLTACLDTVERLRRQDATTSESVSHAQAAVRSAHAKVAFWKSLKDSDQPAVSSLYRLMKLAIEGGGTNLFDSARALATRYRAQGENVTQRAKAEEMLAWQAAGTFGSGFASGVGGILALPVTMPAGLAASLILALRLAASIAVLAGEDPLSPRVAAEIMACAFGSEVIEEEEGAKQHDDSVLADVSARAPDAKNLGEYAAMRAAIALPRAFTVEAIKGVVGRAARVTAARVAASSAARTGAFATAAALPLLGGVVGGAIDSAFTATAGHRALARFFPASGDAAPGTAVAEQVEQARAAAAAQVEQARAAAAGWAKSLISLIPDIPDL